MSLQAHEFIRRFLLHILPEKFTKIRYYGFLASTNKHQELNLIRNQLDIKEPYQAPTKEAVKDIMERLFKIDITRCRRCKSNRLKVVPLAPETSLSGVENKPP